MISLKINKLKKGLVPSTTDHKSDSKKIEEGINKNMKDLKSLETSTSYLRGDVDLTINAISDINLTNVRHDKRLDVLSVEIEELSKYVKSIRACQCKPKVGFFKKISIALNKAYLAVRKWLFGY